MAPGLSNRLEKLESEIHMMLKLQGEVEKVKQEKLAKSRPFARFDTLSPPRPILVQTEKGEGMARPIKSTTSRSQATAKPSLSSNTSQKIELPSGPAVCSLEEIIQSFFQTIESKVKDSRKDAELTNSKGDEDKGQKKRAQSEQLVHSLRQEIRSNRNQLDEIERNKQLAMLVSQQLRRKYEEMRESKQKAELELKKMKAEKEHFKEFIEAEMKAKVEVLEAEKNKALEVYKADVEKRLEQTIKSANKSISMKAIRLSKKVEESGVQLLEAQSKTDHLQKQIETYRKEIEKARRENMALRNKLKIKVSLDGESSEEILKLRRQLFDSQGKETDSEQKIKSLQEEINDLREGCLVKSDMELERMKFEYQMLQNKCELVQKTLLESDKQDRIKFVAIESELRKFTKIMLEKEKILVHEKEDLKRLVEELGHVVQEYKEKVDELLMINTQQQVHIETQKVTITKLDYDLSQSKKESVELKQRRDELEHQVSSLKVTLQSFEQLKVELEEKTAANNVAKERLQILESELIEAKKDLLMKKDQIVVKDKIIDDQANAIKLLKVNVNQQNAKTKKTLEEVDSLESELDKERDEKRHLITSLTKLQESQEQLRISVCSLEGELQEKFRQQEFEHSEDLMKSLNAQLEAKERKWALERDKLLKDKDQAVKATKFVTQKLLDTVTDFQKQVDGQKKVQRLLTSLLKEKETQLKMASKQITDLGLNVKKIMPKTASLEEQNITPVTTPASLTNNTIAATNSQHSCCCNSCCCNGNCCCNAHRKNNIVQCVCTRIPCICRFIGDVGASNVEGVA